MMSSTGAETSVSLGNDADKNGTEVPIPKGYKQTKVGVIPEDWDVVKLKDLLSKDVQNGYSPVCSQVETGHWILGLGALSKYEKLNISDKKSAPKDDDKVKQFILKEKDFLISRANTPERVGFSGVFRSKENIYSYPDLMMRFRVFEELVEVEYLENYLKSFKVIQYLQSTAAGSSSTMVKINKKIVENIKVVLPPLKEQQKIAQIFTNWNNAISKQEALIKAKEELKKGLMQKLLSGEVRFDGFDGEWEDVRLGDVGKIVTGTTPPTANKEYYDNSTYPWITPTDITAKKDISVSKQFLSQIGLEKGRFVPAGSLLVTCIASIGKNAILSVDGSCNQQINAILPSDKNNIEFLYYVMEYYSEYLLKYAGKSATPILNKKSFGDLKFKFPALEEQQKIAQVLTLADKEIDLLKNELEALKEQKRGLMQKLLTGEVRVGGVNTWK